MPRNPTDEEAEDLGAAIESNVYGDIHQERVKAHRKHGAAGNSREDASWDNKEWLPILMEEVGEVAHWFTYDSEMDIDELRNELIQVAAMAAAWIDSIDETMQTTEAEEE